MRGRTRNAIIVVAAVALVAGGILYVRRAAQAKSSLRTLPVKRGDIVATIGATGTLEPEELVDVGAQVAGRIISFGKDKDGNVIDYSSLVEEGTVLAQIDDSLYAADVALAEAALAQERAAEKRAEADLAQSQAKLEQARRDWERAQKLGPSEALAPSAYDGYKAGFGVAEASVGVSEAALQQAKASIAQAEATLQRARRNLGYCTITSPVKGKIIDRRVNIGQTVVASLNAPSLFLIGKDLTRLQAWVSVNEMDIGIIRPEQPVTFTVEAFPGQVFSGQVRKVRLNANMTQNVVMFTVEVGVDNHDGKLLPYLTANVQFETGRHRDVFCAPNASLAWSPRPEQMAPEAGNAAAAAQAPNAGAVAAAASAGNGSRNEGMLWVEKDGLVSPVKVRTGLSDGSQTEVEGAGLAEGMQVVVGEVTPEAPRLASGGGSPFAPQMGPARRSGQGKKDGSSSGAPGGGR
jgi:HlyD family secretion protein